MSKYQIDFQPSQEQLIRRLKKNKNNYKALYEIEKEHSKRLSKLLNEAIELMKSRCK